MRTSAALLRLLFPILLLPTLAASGQKQGLTLIDSLKSELPKKSEDSSKVLLLCEIGYESFGIGLDDAVVYANQAMDLAVKLNWEKGIASAKELIGRHHWRKGDYETALKYHTEALSSWKKLGLKGKIALTHIFIGQDYADSGNYSEALKYLFLAMDDYKAIGSLDNQGVIHNIIAWVYDNMGMYPEALEHQYAALKICEDMNDRSGYAVVSGNLANYLLEQGKYAEAIVVFTQNLGALTEVDDLINESLTYNSLGLCYLKMNNFEEALKQHETALQKGKKINNHRCIAAAYSGMGDVFQARNEAGTALKYFLLAESFFISEQHKPSLAGLYSKIGASYVKRGEYGKARFYFDKSAVLNKELESIGEKNFYYKNIVQLDSATGDWRNAFEHYKLYVSTKDSIYNEANTKRMVQARMQYEFDKKEAEAKAEQDKKDALAKAELQKQKLMRNGFMGGFVVVMLFAGIFFTQRNKIKKGKILSDQLLLNILPAEVAEELKAKGSADAKMIDEVTVLFSDFKDFTHLSETLTPKELVAEINECFSAFDLIMQKHGVEKIKTVGDAYLAAGGLPTPNQTHALNVMNAAIEMQEFMIGRKQQRESAGQFFFEARMGVHTGPVVAGIVGIKKFQYDIWGDTVNTAQRMESGGEAGKVNISGSTFGLVKSDFNCIYRGKIETKGKGEVDMYFVESKDPHTATSDRTNPSSI